MLEHEARPHINRQDEASPHTQLVGQRGKRAARGSGNSRPSTFINERPWPASTRHKIPVHPGVTLATGATVVRKKLPTLPRGTTSSQICAPVRGSTSPKMERITALVAVSTAMNRTHLYQGSSLLLSLRHQLLHSILAYRAPGLLPAVTLL